MKAKKLLALLLALLMVVTMFAACSSDEPAPDAGGNDGGNAGGGNADGGNADGGDEGDEGDEIVTITMWLPDWGSAGTGGKKVDAVHDAINAYTEEKIGVRIDFNWTAAADYATQFTLALSNQDTIDLAVYMPQGANFTALYTQNAMMDITDILAEYAPNTLALLGDYVNATTVDGCIYGLPTYRMLNTNVYAVMRKDVLEELNMVEAAETADSWADWEAILAAFKAHGFDMYALGGGYLDGLSAISNLGGYENWADAVAFDTLGDENNVVYTDKNGNISLLPAEQTWIDSAKRMKTWFDAGYIYPDTFTLPETPQSYIGQGLYAGGLIPTEFGAESSLYQQTGYECVTTQIVANTVTSDACQKFGMFIPFTAAEPEAAAKVIELMYTDPAMINLFTWGVEGETYVVKDGEGFYPDGTDISSCGYHYYDFAVGNQFNILPWDGNGADFRTASLENLLGATPSPYLGLTVDLSAHEALQVAVKSVYSEYTAQLVSGNYSDALYAEYMEKLEAANVNDYLAVFQAQVDDFLN